MIQKGHKNLDFYQAKNRNLKINYFDPITKNYTFLVFLKILQLI